MKNYDGIYMIHRSNDHIKMRLEQAKKIKRSNVKKLDSLRLNDDLTLEEKKKALKLKMTC